MIKYVVAAFIACGVFLSVSAQAAPTLPAFVQAQVASGDVVQKVWHCRRWSGWVLSEINDTN
jgi:hypothetical protein